MKPETLADPRVADWGRICDLCEAFREGTCIGCPTRSRAMARATRRFGFRWRTTIGLTAATAAAVAAIAAVHP